MVQRPQYLISRKQVQVYSLPHTYLHGLRELSSSHSEEQYFVLQNQYHIL